MIEDVTHCSAPEVEAQIAYLSGTPVRGIAGLLRAGRCRLRKGIVRSLDFLRSLKTEFGQVGPHEPPTDQGEQKFRVSEVLPALQGDPGGGGDLLRGIEALRAKDEREIEYNVTVMRVGADLIVKDGNKRTIDFCDRHKDGPDLIEYPVFLVELTDVLERVATKFCASLRERFEGCLAQTAPPTGIPWLNSGIIFRALETCRTEVGDLDKAWDVFCRYTIGDATQKTPEHLVAMAEQVREYLDTNRVLNRYRGRRCGRLSEWITDFSLSYGTVEEAYGAGGWTPSEFQLLLTAESEINGGPEKAMEDLFRLFFVVSPLRVLLFREGLSDIRRHICTMMDVHKPHERAPTAEWLFLGVPTYTQWWEHAEKRTPVKCDIYSLPAGTPLSGLRSNPEWWGP